MAKAKKEESNNPDYWIYEGKKISSIQDMPKGAISFIYRIENVTTGRYYIGRRTFSSSKKKKLTAKEKLLPENARKTFKYEICEVSGWKKYCGSNTTLKEEVKNGHKIEKYILCFCYSKAETTYKETEAIICGQALLDPLSYNDWCSAKIYKKFLKSR